MLVCGSIQYCIVSAFAVVLETDRRFSSKDSVAVAGVNFLNLGAQGFFEFGSAGELFEIIVWRTRGGFVICLRVVP